MRKTLKRTLAILLAVVMIAGTAPLGGFVGLDLPDISSIFVPKAEAASYSGSCGENLTWSLDESTGALTITGSGAMDNYDYSTHLVPWYNYCSSISKVTISNGVTSIGDYAFYYCSAMTSIVIPDSVTSIGNCAFYYCKGLTGITIPDSVTSIGNEAFLNCTGLTSIIIPGSVAIIGNEVFNWCGGLTCIIVDENNLHYSSDEYGVLFDKDKTTLIQYPVGKSETSYAIPDGVITICDYAFYKCTALTDITIPDSVKGIGDAVFTGTGYYNDTSNWDNGVLYIDNCLIKARGYIDELSGYGDALAGDYDIKNGTTVIANYAFFYCTELMSVTIPESVIYIGDSAFLFCTELTSVTIPESVVYIGDMAFEFCINLTGAINLNGIFYSGSFYGTKINNITLGNEARAIGEMYGVEFGNNPFYAMASVECVTVDRENPYYSTDENGVLFNKDKTELLFYPLGNVRESYRIPNGTKKIAVGAFFGFSYSEIYPETKISMPSNLKNIVLPDSVETIEEASFIISDACVHVPPSVTTIVEDAFLTESMAEELSFEIEKFPYICSDTEDCYAKEYADANGIEFVLCEGHEVHTHSYTSSVTAEPTCTEDGVRTYSCECGENYTEAIPASGHTAGGWETVTEPTTTTEGEMVKKCGICGEVTERKAIPTVTEYTITFFVNGISVYTASYQERETIDFNNIPDDSCVMVEGYTFNGWFDENGNAFGSYTTMPAENLEYQAVFTANTYTLTFNANGGEFFDGSEIKTYEVAYGTVIEFPEDPTRIGYCFLGYNPSSIPKTMPAMDMTFTAVWEEIEIEHTHTPKTVTIPASCTAAGAEYQVCDECGEPIGEATAIPASGHSAGDWETITKATCTADGTKVKKCIACGETVETGTVPSTGHTAGEWETVLEPTVTSEGKKVIKCTACGDVLEEEVIPMLRTVTVTDDESGISLTYPEDDYSGNVDVVVEKSFDGAAFNLVDTTTNAVQTFIYDITMMIDGVETQPSGKITVKIPLPEGYNSARTYVYHVDTSTGKVEKMPAEYVAGYMVFETDHFSYYALVEEYSGTLDIRTPSTTSISYGDSIILHADVSEALPEGWSIKWTADNGNFDYSVSADGATCTISPSSSGNTTFTAAVCDADGNEVSSDTQTMTSKAGFFDKLIAFFKKLFGLTKTISQVFKGVI